MKIDWNNNFNTGVEEIDSHHRDLFDKINELRDAIEHKEGLTTIRNLTIYFESFLMSHFTLEEVLQDRLRYPDYKTHCEQHEHLRENFSNLMKLIDTKGASPDFASDAIENINNFMTAYITHVNTADKKLTEFLRNTWS